MSQVPDEAPPVEVHGEALTPLDRFWLDTTRGVVKESIGAHEEAAKQLIAITSFAQTIYFAAISFSDLKKGIVTLPPLEQWLVAVMLAFPLVFWIVSLFFAIRVFVPETYHTNLNSPELAREAYEQIVSYKHTQLRRAQLLLVAGFVPLVLTIVVYLAVLPVPVQ